MSKKSRSYDRIRKSSQGLFVGTQYEHCSRFLNVSSSMISIKMVWILELNCHTLHNRKVMGVFKLISNLPSLSQVPQEKCHKEVLNHTNLQLAISAKNRPTYIVPQCSQICNSDLTLAIFKSQRNCKIEFLQKYDLNEVRR